MFLQTCCLQHVYCDSFGRGERSDPLSGMDCTLNIHSNPVFWFPFNTRSSEGCWAAKPQWSCLSIQKQAEGGIWFIYSVYCLLSVLGLWEWINFLQISPKYKRAAKLLGIWLPKQSNEIVCMCVTPITFINDRPDLFSYFTLWIFHSEPLV